VPAKSQPASTTRFQKALQNDARVLQALIEVLAGDGWASFSARQVSQRAGVSQQAVQDRYPNRSDMAIGAWEKALSQPLGASLHGLLSAHGTLAAPPDAARAHASWRPFAEPDAHHRAALEVLFAAPFDEDLLAAIHATLGEQVQRWTQHDNSSLPRRLATQRAYLIGRALGLILVGSIVDLAAVDMGASGRAILRALADPARVGRATPPPLPMSLSGEHFTSGDDALDALLTAATRLIARRGFHDATVQAIAEEAGSTKDTLLSRYPSKAALFLDATKRRLEQSLPMNIAWIETINRRYGEGRGEAEFLRAGMQPDLDTARRLAREELRLTIRTPELRSAFVAFHEAFARSWGDLTPQTLGASYALRAPGEGISLLLPILAPEAWALPFEVVVVALSRELHQSD
jgi:AcrR family transcriptional regulator